MVLRKAGIRIGQVPGDANLSVAELTLRDLMFLSVLCSFVKCR